jgi:tetratricopeptide (TPR) repeat protein
MLSAGLGNIQCGPRRVLLECIHRAGLSVIGTFSFGFSVVYSKVSFESVFAFLLVAAVTGTASVSISQQQFATGEKSEAHKAPSPMAAELGRRVAEADAARASENPERIGDANGRLIAFCLREMGQLRLIEASYPQAVELYRSSLQFEDIPDTRVDLAIAYLYENKLDEAIAETSKVLVSDPKNARAWNVQGKAWMKKQDPGKAAESLEHSIELHPDLEAAYSLGISLLAAKQKENADAVFGRMVDAAGDSGPLRVLFARAYRDANFLNDTIRELKKAIAMDTTTPHAHYFLGLSYLTLNLWAPTPQSSEEFKKELQYHPHDFLSNYFLGVIASQGQRYEESDRYLKLAGEINPNSPHTWLYLGLNAYGQGRNQAAEAYLRRAIDLSAGNESEANYLIRKGYVVLGRILATSGRHDEAQPYLKKARDLQNLSLKESQQDVADIQAAAGAGMGAAAIPAISDKKEDAPQIPESQNADPTAQIDASVLADSNLTEDEKQQAVAQEKSLRSILGTSFNDLATSEAVRQKYQPALDHYREAERWDPDIPGLLRNSGIAAFRLQNYTEAIRTLSKVLAADPGDKQSRAMLGMAYYATDEYASAQRTISPLGQSAMDDPGLAYIWAASLTRTGDLKQASKVLAAVDKVPLSPPTVLLVAQLWTDIGDYSRAVKMLHDAALADPSLPKAHYYAGLAQLRADHPAEAVTEFKAELELTPNDPDAQYSLGFAYLQLSQADAAAALFGSVIAAHPEHSNAQYQLGKLLLDQGKLAEAVQHLEQAARFSPDTDYIHYQLQAAYRKESRLQDADRELQLYRKLKAEHRQLDVPKPIQDQ